MILTDQEVERYARQVVMPEIGEVGQKRLLDAKVLILGAGGLGAPVIAGLAGAGRPRPPLAVDGRGGQRGVSAHIASRETQLSGEAHAGQGRLAARRLPRVGKGVRPRNGPAHVRRDGREPSAGCVKQTLN